jgi:hypothetical protein
VLEVRRRKVAKVLRMTTNSEGATKRKIQRNVISRNRKERANVLNGKWMTECLCMTELGSRAPTTRVDDSGAFLMI